MRTVSICPLCDEQIPWPVAVSTPVPVFWDLDSFIAATVRQLWSDLEAALEDHCKTHTAAVMLTPGWRQ